MPQRASPGFTLSPTFLFHLAMFPYKAVIKKSVPFPWWVTNWAFRVPRDLGSFLLLILLVRVHLLLSVKWVLVLVTQLCSQRRRRRQIIFPLWWRWPHRALHLWHQLGREVWRYSLPLAFRSQRRPYLFRCRREPRQALPCRLLSCSIWRCYPIKNGLKGGPQLTFSMVGERLGISSLMWSGRLAKARL